MFEWLVELGVPAGRMMIESDSANTREQIATVQRFLAHRPDDRTAIVVSRLQMPRVARLARQAGLTLVLVPSPVDTEPPKTGVRVFVPTYTALRVSRDSLYEHTALAYYRWRGWIARG